MQKITKILRGQKIEFGEGARYIVNIHKSNVLFCIKNAQDQDVEN